MWAKSVLLLLLLSIFTSGVNCSCHASPEKTSPPTTTVTSTTTATTTTTTPTTTTTTPTTTTELTTITPPYVMLDGNCSFTLPAQNIVNPAPANSCEDGWTAFRREKGIVCLKTFTGSVNQYNAYFGCQKFNATIAGLENNQERSWLHSQFIQYASPTNEVLSVWIGGFRKTECQVLTNFPASCLPPEKNMFYWTDTSVTGNDMFCPWWRTDPDNASGKVVQNCLQFAIMANPGPHTEWDITQGSLDDTMCTITQGIIGYVCVKTT